MKRSAVLFRRIRWMLVATAGVASIFASSSSRPARYALVPTLQAFDHVLADPAVSREAVWSVRDGVLSCTGTPLGVLFTREEYTDARIEVEYRWAPGTKPGNSGIMARLAPGSGALPQTLEVQLQHGNAGDVIGLKGFTVGAPQQPRWFERNTTVAGKVTGVKKAHAAEKPAGEWNRVEIELRGDRCVVQLNGQLVNDVTGIEVKPGRIGLQSEGGEIHFRELRIQSL